MKLSEVVNQLCNAIDARHTGCEIEVSADDVRVRRTFPYAGARDLRITDVLRAVVLPDWREALAVTDVGLKARIVAYEEGLKLERRKWVWVRGGTAIQRSGVE